ncbi:MAG: M48 family metallopeptidase [Anaerolineae bacterium]|jgi:STE24 endopeptidase
MNADERDECGLEIPDPERQVQARRYARLHRRLIPINLGLGLVWLLGLLFSGAAVTLRQALSDLTASRALVVTLFSGIVGGGYALLDLPLSYYSGFVLPHRFGLSTQGLSDWIVDQLKVGLVGGTLGLLMVQGLYLALTVWPDTWWLPLGGVYLLFSVVLSALSPVLVAPLFFKFTPLEEEHKPLADRLTTLAEQAGTHVRGVYRIDMSRRTKAANAGLMGLGRSRRIVLGDTLLAEFTPDEIETILAHELAHQVHHDLPLGILAQSFITLSGLWLASLALVWGVDRLGLEGVNDVAGLPWLALVMGGFGLITLPLVNGWSRWRERLADRYAIQATGAPLAFASALVRLADQNLAEVEPPRWVEFLLYSHPPVGKRIAAARNTAQRE